MVMIWLAHPAGMMIKIQHLVCKLGVRSLKKWVVILDPASPISKVEFQPWKWKRRWSDVRSLAWTGPMLIIITITIWVSKNGIPARIIIIIYLLINVSHFLQPPITQVLNKITPLFWVWPRIGGRHAGYGTQGADHPVTRCPPLCHYLPHCFASFAVLVSWGTWSSQVHWPHIDCCVCFFLLFLLKLELAADFQMTLIF